MDFDSMDFVFDFFKHPCRTCISIDYERPPLEENRGLVRKTSFPIVEKVELKRIPVNLLKNIVEKMDQRSFTRMRRTEKKISKFVEKNREVLRISLFHNFKILFNPKKDGDGPEVSFFCPPAVIYEEADYEDPVLGRYRGPDPIFGSLEGFVTSEFAQFSGAVKTEMGKIEEDDVDQPMITVSLKQWNENPELRKELSGVYHATAINFGPFESVEEIHLVCEFMKFAGLKKNKLIVYKMADQCLQTLCKSTEPVGLADCNGRHSVEIFSQNGFETLEELILVDSSPIPYVSHMEKLQKLQIDFMNPNNVDTSVIFADAAQLIQKWRNGKAAINEMVLNGNATLKATDFGGTVPSETERTRMAKHFVLRKEPDSKFAPTFRRHTQLDRCTRRCQGDLFDIKTSGGMNIPYWNPIDGCLLQCEALNKTAILCSVRTIYFKEI